MVDKNGHIVIVGGGIIGCSTAYYLAKAGYSNVTVCEAVNVAHAASGSLNIRHTHTKIR